MRRLGLSAQPKPGVGVDHPISETIIINRFSGALSAECWVAVENNLAKNWVLGRRINVKKFECYRCLNFGAHKSQTLTNGRRQVLLHKGICFLLQETNIGVVNLVLKVWRCTHSCRTMVQFVESCEIDHKSQSLYGKRVGGGPSKFENSKIYHKSPSLRGKRVGGGPA